MFCKLLWLGKPGATQRTDPATGGVCVQNFDSSVQRGQPAVVFHRNEPLGSSTRLICRYAEASFMEGMPKATYRTGSD